MNKIELICIIAIPTIGMAISDLWLYYYNKK